MLASHLAVAGATCADIMTWASSFLPALIRLTISTISGSACEVCSSMAAMMARSFSEPAFSRMSDRAFSAWS